MKRAILSLALLLGLTAKANALCAIQPTGLGLGIPTYGDSGPAWNACITTDLLWLNSEVPSTASLAGYVSTGTFAASTGTLTNTKASTGTCTLPNLLITLNSGNVVCAQPSNVNGNAATVTNGMYSNAGPYEAVRVGTATVSTYTTGSAASVPASGIGSGTNEGVRVGTATVSTYTTGNAASVTNGIYSNGSYSRPSWLTSVASEIVSGLPSASVGHSATASALSAAG